MAGTRSSFPIENSIQNVERVLLELRLRDGLDREVLDPGGRSAVAGLVDFFMLTALGLVAVGLYGTLSYHIAQRTREIGVMRAIGASNWDIQAIVLVEGMVIGIISWAISIFISIPITNVLCYGVGVSIMTSPMPAVYGASGIIAWLIFILFLAAISSAIPARRASRLTVKDTLAYE